MPDRLATAGAESIGARGEAVEGELEVRLIPPAQDDPVALAAVIEWARRVIERRRPR